MSSARSWRDLHHGYNGLPKYAWPSPYSAPTAEGGGVRFDNNESGAANSIKKILWQAGVGNPVDLRFAPLAADRELTCMLHFCSDPSAAGEDTPDIVLGFPFFQVRYERNTETLSAASGAVEVTYVVPSPGWTDGTLHTVIVGLNSSLMYLLVDGIPRDLGFGATGIMASETDLGLGGTVTAVKSINGFRGILSVAVLLNKFLTGPQARAWNRDLYGFLRPRRHVTPWGNRSPVISGGLDVEPVVELGLDVELTVRLGLDVDSTVDFELNSDPTVDFDLDSDSTVDFELEVFKDDR